MKKNKINLLLGYGLIVESFISCCYIPDYISKDNICISCSSDLDTNIDAEFSVYDYWGNIHSSFFLYSIMEKTATIGSNNVKILYKGRNLRYTIKKYDPYSGLWKKARYFDLNGESLIKYDFKSKLKEGDSVRIINTDFPLKGDSFVATIIVPKLFVGPRQYPNPESRVRKFLFHE